jgi:pimeloyl-ACP methyl ester carboxylesterase
VVTDRELSRDGLRLAVRDYGGEGSPIILLHGAGRTLLDCDPMARLLTARHRVVALDLRCHGLSGDATWDWDEVCKDVLYVADQLALQTPAIVGHSLGGMVAAKCGRAPARITAAVNIDGHGTGKPEQYVGLSPEAVAEGRAQLKAMVDATLTAAPMSVAQADAGRQQSLTTARELGLSEQLAEESWQRSTRATADGVVTRPDGVYLQQLMAALEDLDLFADYRDCAVPLLIFNATEPMPHGSPEWAMTLMAAFRAGLRLDLATLERESRHVSAVEIPTTHALILTDTADVAKHVLDFLAAPTLTMSTGVGPERHLPRRTHEDTAREQI